MVYSTLNELCAEMMLYKINLTDAAIRVGDSELTITSYVYSDLLITKNTLMEDIFFNCINKDSSTQVLLCRNLTIDEGCVLTPPYRCKGLVIFAGNITNNGEISMTARGASANGQNIYLFEDNNGEIQCVPAIGALGGTGLSAASIVSNGIPGANGTNRQSGGGGGGACYHGSSGIGTSGAGGTGTSYSGGCGGGSVSAYSTTVAGGDGSSSGGAGGGANCRRTTANNWNATGGTGNDSGVGRYQTMVNGTKYATKSRYNGTGGLLITYSYQFINNGIVSSNGVQSDNNNPRNISTHCATGGASGGGSVNIITMSFKNNGSIVSAGGTGAEGRWIGGSGGNGCITIDTEIMVNPINIKLDCNTCVKILAVFASKIYKEYNSPYVIPDLPELTDNKFITTETAIELLLKFSIAICRNLNLNIPINEQPVSPEFKCQVISQNSFLLLLSGIYKKITGN